MRLNPNSAAAGDFTSSPSPAAQSAVLAPPPLLVPPPLPHGPDVEALLVLLRDGEFGKFWESIEHPKNIEYWAAPHGRYVLRYLVFTAASLGRRSIVFHSCELCKVPVNAIPAEEGLWQIPLAVPNHLMTPLVGALFRRHEDLALELLRLPDQELDLDHRIDDRLNVLLHLCVEKELTRAVKELVRQGADIDLWNGEHHTPLCLAAGFAHIPLVRFFLQQYKKRGQSELERVMQNPCKQEKADISLLGHALKNCDSGDMVHVDMVRYLVQEWGADVWRTVDLKCKCLPGCLCSAGVDGLATPSPRGSASGLPQDGLFFH